MMTLLPMAAFADASKGASVISLNATSKSVGSEVKVKVVIRDSNNRNTNNLGGKNLFVWAERTDNSVSDVDDPQVGVTGDVYKLSNKVVVVTKDGLDNGTVEIKYKSNIAGDVVFKAALTEKNFTNPKDLESDLIGKRSFEWRQRGADEIVLVENEGNFAEDMKWVVEGTVKYTDKENNEKEMDFSTTVEGNQPTDAIAKLEEAFGDRYKDYDIEAIYNVTVRASGNVYKLEGFEADGEEYEFVFEVRDNRGNPLAGEKVEFSINKRGALLNKDEATTDVLGQVKVKVYAYEANDYKLTVKKGSVVAVVELDFGASTQPFDIEGPGAIADKVAIGYHPSLEFKVYDVFGNRMLESALKNIVGPLTNNIEDNPALIKKPSGSDLEDSDLKLVVDGNVLKVEFDNEPDVAGVYQVRVKLENGKYATATFEAAEQGDITRMALDIKESYLAYGSKSSAAKVKYYDDNNVYYEDSTLGAVELSVSNSALAKIEGNKVVAREAKHNDFSSGKVVITAIDTARGLVATDEITIGSMIAGLEVAVPDEDVLVDEAAVITYQLVNQNGDPIAFDPANKGKIDVDAYVVSAPEGANVDIKLPLKSDYQNSLSRTGKIDVEVESEVAGNVVIAFVVNGVVNYGDGANDEDVTLSNTTEIKFVAERVKIGAENVTLFIGSTNYVVDGQPKVSDLAPFIQDNRTFVPVRVVAEALGAEVEWDEATQTVTIAREDLTATLTIGSNEITLSDGTVVVSDVAPFIKEGRTVLPFRVIGEIFGAEVEAVSAADGRTIAVTFEQ